MPPTLNYFNYFTEIEETFIRRRGKHLLLSPLDWDLIESWKQRGIPLRIVLRGIENVFDVIEKNPKRSRNVKSITYCRDEIESLYEDWRGSQIGKQVDTADPQKKKDPSAVKQPTLFSESSIENHLGNVIAELEVVITKTATGMRETLDEVILQLKKHKKTFSDAEALEKNLSELEDMIDEALLKFCDTDLLSELRLEVAGGLSRQKDSIATDVYQRTFDLMLLKRLREHAAIPRLSLFYL